MSEIGIFPNKSYRSKNNSPRCKASFSVDQSNHGRPGMDTSDICFLVQRLKTFEGLQLAQKPRIQDISHVLGPRYLVN